MANRFGLKTMPEIQAKIEEILVGYNAAIQDGNYGYRVDVPNCDEAYNPIEGTVNLLAREVVDELVNDNTRIARSITFAKLKASEDPMLEAVKQLTFETVRVVDEKVGEGKAKIPKTSLKPAEKYIDILRLDEYVGGEGIGKNKHWNGMIEKLNFLLTVDKAVSLGIDPTEINNSYAISNIGKEIDLGKTPTSNTNMLKTLNLIVSAMIGDGYKADSHDIAYLKSVYTKKGKKALSVSCSNHKFMRQYMAEICHRIVTGESYSVEYKAFRK